MFNKVRVSLEFKPQDMWIGIYWKYNKAVYSKKIKKYDVWVCLVPMFPVHISYVKVNLEVNQSENN